MVDDLFRPEAWPDGRDLPIEREETHVSVVLLRGDVALKIKKPVSLGFLDFSTPEARRRACDDEVRLNRRLAEDVYLGVDDVRLDGEGRWTLAGDGPVVDAAVRMKRLPAGDTLEARLADGRLAAADLRRVAARIARFHDACARGDAIDRHAEPDRIRANAEENFAAAGRAAEEILGPGPAARARERLRRFLDEHEDRLRARIAAGRICDGHGDLRLDHVYVRGEAITVLDCVEFADRYRCGDVASDVAFLAMDLAWRGHPDLAERWLAEYAAASGDVDLYGVVDLYCSYRAWVRAKIEIALGRPDRARRYLLLALAELSEPVEPPRILVALGPIASGKSTLAARLADLLHLPVLATDPVRKRLLGVAPTARAGSAPFAGAYDAAVTRRVYDELLRGAEVVVRSGRSVVLDATFRTAASRAEVVALARRLGAGLELYEAWAPVDVLRERLRRREGRGTVSDARADLLEAFLAAWEPPTELPVRRIDTSGR